MVEPKEHSGMRPPKKHLTQYLEKGHNAKKLAFKSSGENSLVKAGVSPSKYSRIDSWRNG
jgi:hypothetical protein